MDRDWLKKYLRSVEKSMVGSKEDKRAFLDGLTNDVMDYLECHSDCTAEEVYLQFGKPEEIAQGYLSTLDEDTLRKAIQRKRWIRISVFVIALLILIAVVAYYATTHIRQEQYRNGAFVETITTDDPANSEYAVSSGSDTRYY